MLRKTLTAAAAAVLALGMAAPAHAELNTEVRVTFDPLDWEWDIPFAFEGKGSASGYEQRQFVARPGQGPQWLFTFHAASNTFWGHNSYALTVGESTLTAGGVTRVTEPLTASVLDTAAGVGFTRSDSPADIENGQSGARRPPENPDAVVLEVSKNSFTDPTTGGDFVELKWYPSQNAPRVALMNLHEVQKKGVRPEDCTHSAELSAGDTLTTSDEADIVCVTVKDGHGESEEIPIVVETGDGNDVVLIEGESDSRVEVDTGAGDDVVVVDADAKVEVEGGDGHDAAVIDDDDTFDGGDGDDGVLASS